MGEGIRVKEKDKKSLPTFLFIIIVHTLQDARPIPTCVCIHCVVS